MMKGLYRRLEQQTPIEILDEPNYREVPIRWMHENEVKRRTPAGVYSTTRVL
jgi:hypothetical protein